MKFSPIMLFENRSYNLLNLWKFFYSGVFYKFGGIKLVSCRRGDRRLKFFHRGYQVVGDEMKKPVDFKRFAEECIRLAAVVTPIEDKAILLSMGETWLRLAEHAGSVQALLEGDGSQTS